MEPLEQLFSQQVGISEALREKILEIEKQISDERYIIEYLSTFECD